MQLLHHIIAISLAESVESEGVILSNVTGFICV